MPTVDYGCSLSGGGVSIKKTMQRSTNGPTGREIPLPAGKAGTLSTRTNATQGIATLGGGHGIATGNTVDLYWVGGRRFGVTVGTVSGNSVPFSGGTGNDLPAQAFALVMTKVVLINVDIDGEALEIVGVSLEYDVRSEDSDGHATFFDVDDEAIVAIDLAANEARVWDVAGGSDNPFEGDETDYPVARTCHASNGSATNAAVIKIVWGQDATPEV